MTMAITASASKLLIGEQETYLPMTKSNTAPVTKLYKRGAFMKRRSRLPDGSFSPIKDVFSELIDERLIIMIEALTGM